MSHFELTIISKKQVRKIDIFKATSFNEEYTRLRSIFVFLFYCNYPGGFQFFFNVFLFSFCQCRLLSRLYHFLFSSFFFVVYSIHWKVCTVKGKKSCHETLCGSFSNKAIAFSMEIATTQLQRLNRNRQSYISLYINEYIIRGLVLTIIAAKYMHSFTLLLMICLLFFFHSFSPFFGIFNLYINFHK